MDSAIENAKLADEHEELDKEQLLKAMAEARASSDAVFMRHLLQERARRNQQQEHARKPK